jgi:hypothetical protein
VIGWPDDERAAQVRTMQLKLDEPNQQVATLRESGNRHS